MSGGYFDYEQYRFHDIAESIKYEIDSNGTPYEDEYRNEFCFKDGKRYPENIIEKFKEAYRYCRLAEIYATRIDYLLEGDDSEETFLERLEADMKSFETEYLNGVGKKEEDNG